MTADVLTGRRWPLGTGQPDLGLPYLYGTAGLPADHQLRGMRLVSPGSTGMGVMFVPVLALLMVGCDYYSQTFDAIRDHTRVIGPDDHNPFDQPVGQTMMAPMPVQWTSLTLPRGGDIYAHPGAFNSWAGGHGLSEITTFAHVPTVLWDFDEGSVPGPAKFSATLASDPVDVGGNALRNRDGSFVWSWTVWPLDDHEYAALCEATEHHEHDVVWGTCGCHHDLDSAEYVEAYLDSHPDVYSQAYDAVKADQGTVEEGDIYDWVFSNYDGEALDWWLREAHADPWDVVDMMLEHGPGKEVLPVLRELRRSTEKVDAAVRDLLNEGDPSWAFSFQERYLWPAH